MPKSKMFRPCLLYTSIKVTPSSKVVGDMTLFMVQNNLTEVYISRMAFKVRFGSAKDDVDFEKVKFEMKEKRLPTREEMCLRDRNSSHLSPCTAQYCICPDRNNNRRNEVPTCVHYPQSGKYLSLIHISACRIHVRFAGIQAAEWFNVRNLDFDIFLCDLPECCLLYTSHKLKPIVVINKIDRPDQRISDVEGEIHEQFKDLDRKSVV